MKKAIGINIVLVLHFFIPLTVSAQQGVSMLRKSDSSIVDDPGKEWCYLNKSTTVIGVPFQPDVTQVTYDGALYTRNAELCFFYGKQNTPLMARQKTFLNGWMPIVEYDWKDGFIQYNIEMFASSLDGRDASNSINFVRLSVKNKGQQSADYNFSAALRGRLNDFRFGALNGYLPDSNYKMDENNTVWHDNRLMYVFSPGSKRLAVPGVLYTQSFSGKEYSITEESPVCMASYQKRLKPGETATLIFKMPRIPVTENEPRLLLEIRDADYQHYRAATISYWENLLNKNTRYEIPEKRVEDAQKASMVHLLLATRTMEDSSKSQTDGLPYPMFFLTSAAQEMMAYLSYGQFDMARLIILNAVKQQEADGMYFDRSLAHEGAIPAAHGHVLYAATAYYLFTHDTATARMIFPGIQKAIGYLEKSIGKDEYGLLPPTYPYDNEMIDGHYTSNNLWALLGLRYAIRLARDLNEPNDVVAWETLEKRYRENILKGIDASASTGGYVPPGLYPYLTGTKARRGFKEYQTNSDWENMLLSFPTELLSPDDPHVSGTLKQVRKGYAEGVMTYRHGQHLHQYITANMIEQYMTQGNSRQALTDFYHLLVHSGSTHEEFENLVEPWKDREVSQDCPPPHAWASAKTASLIRNFLIHEYGGNGGLEKGKRDLYLFSVISPAWTKAGEHISFINAPTEMGNVSATISFSANTAEVKIDANYQTLPGAIRIRIPYFKKLNSFTTDARHSSLEDGYIVLSPDVHKLTIHWNDIPNAHKGTVEQLLTDYRSRNYLSGIDSMGVAIIKQEKPFLLKAEKTNQQEPLSFDLIKNTFLYEYNRRTRK